MGKGKRLKSKRKRLGDVFYAEISDRLTENFRRELRNSELWDEMVAEFGEERARELLRECKAGVKTGVVLDEGRDRTKDIL